MFGRRTKAKATGKAARGAGKAAGGAGKVLLRSGTARRAVGTTARGAAKGAGKTAGGAGKVFLKSGTARKAARGAGKAAVKGGTRALRPRESTGARLLKYGLFALAGLAIGTIIVRLRQEREVSSSFTGDTGLHAPDFVSPASETWGSGGPPGAAGGATDIGTVPPEHQRPEEPNRTGAEREYSDPASGPLIGRQHQPLVDIPEQEQEVEQRIRTRVGEDPRTLGMHRLNVEVNDGVADIRGVAPSEAAKEAVTEIAASVEGVIEVRNLMSVNA